MSSLKKAVLIIICGLFTTTSAALAAGILPPCTQTGDCTACDFVQTFVNMEKYALGGMGSLALIFFVYGGFKLVLSRGNSEAVSSAHGILLNTVIGVLFILLAWILVNFIILALTGQTDNVGVIFDGKKWYQACKY